MLRRVGRYATTMALLENFKREDAQYAGCKLPDPQGALAKEVPPSQCRV